MTSHDRAGFRRTDDAWLDEVWSDDATRVVVMSGERFEVEHDRVVWCSPAKATEGHRLFLGLRDDVPHFAVLAEPESDAGSAVMLFQVATLLSSDEAGLMVHATALS